LAYGILARQSAKKWRYDFKPTKEVPVYHTGVYRLTLSPGLNSTRVFDPEPPMNTLGLDLNMVKLNEASFVNMYKHVYTVI